LYAASTSSGYYATTRRGVSNDVDQRLPALIDARTAAEETALPHSTIIRIMRTCFINDLR
jgi:hypothetical protein